MDLSLWVLFPALGAFGFWMGWDASARATRHRTTSHYLDWLADELPAAIMRQGNVTMNITIESVLTGMAADRQRIQSILEEQQATPDCQAAIAAVFTIREQQLQDMKAPPATSAADLDMRDAMASKGKGK